MVAINLGFLVLGFAVGSSSLTFNWVLEHRAAVNYFPEFAGRVVYLSDILVIAGIFIWLSGRLLVGDYRCRFGLWYVGAPLLTLLSLSALSVLWAADQSQAAAVTLRGMMLLALYLVTVNGPRKAALLMIMGFFLVGLLQAGVSLAQKALGGPVGVAFLGELSIGHLYFPLIGQPRAVGLGFSPNPAATYMAVVSSLAFSTAILIRSGVWVRVLAIATFVATLAGVMVALSRAALLGLILALALVAVLHWALKRNRRGLRANGRQVASIIITLTLLSIPTLALVLSSGDFFNMERILPTNYLTGLAGRFEEIRLSTQIAGEHLALGVGAGNYPQALKAMVSSGFVGGGFVPVHNVTALVVAELGILGGVAWMMIMVAPLVWLLSVWYRRRVDSMALLWLGPLTVVLFSSLWEFHPWATQDGRVMFWALIGLWVGSCSPTRSLPAD